MRKYHISVWSQNILGYLEMIVAQSASEALFLQNSLVLAGEKVRIERC